MTCIELMTRLAEYLGDELVVEHRETFKLHIDGCPKCGSYVATVEHTTRIVRALPKCGQLPPAFEAKLRAALADYLGEPG
ncbi:MAG: anti-sigma factor family protein [Gemmata sp.]